MAPRKATGRFNKKRKISAVTISPHESDAESNNGESAKKPSYFKKGKKAVRSKAKMIDPGKRPLKITPPPVYVILHTVANQIPK